MVEAETCEAIHEVEEVNHVGEENVQMKLAEVPYSGYDWVIGCSDTNMSKLEVCLGLQADLNSAGSRGIGSCWKVRLAPPHNTLHP